MYLTNNNFFLNSAFFCIHGDHSSIKRGGGLEVHGGMIMITVSMGFFCKFFCKETSFHCQLKHYIKVFKALPSMWLSKWKSSIQMNFH